jgi:acetyl-CoA carboxylase carboxyl transferase subunit beta
MTWFRKDHAFADQDGAPHALGPGRLWMKCAACDAVLYRAGAGAQPARVPEVRPPHAHRCARAPRVLPRSGHPVELAREVEPEDPLKFRDSKKYRDRLAAGAEEHAGEGRAESSWRARCTACRSWPAAFEFRFLGGSMGSVVGERFVRGVEHCLEHPAPLSAFSRERWRAHAGSAAVADADGEDQLARSRG